MARYSVDKQAKRIEVLLQFRERAVASGYSVPSTADMVRIAETQEIWPSGIDVALAKPWERTIVELFKQINHGVNDPIDALDTDLRRPAGEFIGRDSGRRAGGPGPLRPGASRVLEALQSWRRANQDRSALRALKDNHLTNIARTRSRTVTEIARLLPREATGLAREMSEVVKAALAADDSALDDRTDRTDRTGPTPDVDAAEPAPGARPTSTRSPAATTVETPLPTPLPTPPPEPHPGPPPTPVPAPGAATERTDAADERARPAGADGDERLKALDLADGDYAPEERPPLQIRKRKLPTGGMSLTWPVADGGGGVVVYRIVAVDDFDPPRRPQDATPVAVTTGVRYVDDRPFECAVRHVQVWYHQGATEEAAAAAPPVLHAGLLVVAPPRDAVVAEDSGHVTGSWGVFADVERVAVTRYRHGDWQRNRHGAQSTNLEWGDGNISGFVDETVTRGERYLYEVASEVVVDGVRHLSDAVDFEVLVPGVLAAVTDLRIVERGDRADLSWTPPPAGQVVLYRTPNAPAAGATSKPLATSELEVRAGLPAAQRLPIPSGLGQDGRAHMGRVGFLTGLTRMYVTPVTVLGDRSWVGRTVPTVRLTRVEHAVLVERMHQQVMTFAWPSGADAVWVWVTPVEQPAEAAMANRPEDISQLQYERQGGMYFRDTLPWRGCAVHAAAVAYTNARTVVGQPVTLRYPGLLRLRYTVGLAPDKAGRRMRLTIQIFSQQDSPSAPAFVLVHNPERMPLDLWDGGRDSPRIVMRPTGDPAAVEGVQFRPSELRSDPGAAAWTTDLPALTGYVRLFACLEDDRLLRVALLDPPVAALRLDAPHGPGR